MNTKIRQIISAILALNLIFSINLFAVAENEDSWKNKIDEEIYEKITDKDTKVPVYIWLTDVEHEEVIAETEETLGYGEEDLAVIDEDFSDELAISVSNLSETDDESVSDELAKYLKKTEKKRKAEKEKTDKYIEKKREKYRDKYNEKSKDFLEKAKIEGEYILFRSQYSPMIIAELTEKQIKKVAKSDEVCEITYYHKRAEKPATVELSELIENTNIDVFHDIGLTGNGVSVGIEDYGDYNVTEAEMDASRVVLIESLYDEDYPSDVTADDLNHVNLVLRLGFGQNGIAPQTTSYIISDSYFSYSDLENLLNSGVSIITRSVINEDVSGYTDSEKWFDHIATYHNVTIVQGAGNEAGAISAPGLAYNIITVGGYDNSSLNDNVSMYAKSNYVNTGYCEKPDVVAPAFIFNASGTSFSTPFVSAVIALMLELRPSLAAYPHIVKAITLASCHRKALTTNVVENITDGITDKQGAGLFDPYTAISIAGRGNYGARFISAGTTSTDVKFNVPYLYGATGMNVSIAWLRNTTISGSHDAESDATGGDLTNLNLSVLNGSSTVGTSSLCNSSTEMVYVSSPVAGSTYTVRINRTDSSSETVKVAYAWSFDEEQFQYTGDFEGVYFIKNKQSGNYLNYTSSTGFTQNTFTGANAQKWVVWQSSNGYYLLKPFAGNTGCLDMDSVVSGQYFSIGLDSLDTADASILLKDNGAVEINKGGSQYLLSVLNNSSSVNAQVVWKRINNNSEKESGMEWYLEPICYQVGDIDMDGQIAADDSRTALNYSAGSTSYGNMTNIKEYLTDANSDGLITAADSRLILRFASGLE